MSCKKSTEIYLSTVSNSGLFARNFCAFYMISTVKKYPWKPVYYDTTELIINLIFF